jgi:nitroreductase
MKDFLTLTHERYSCRGFSDQPVEEEKIEKVLEAGLDAPTAVNKQPVRIWVIRSEDALQKVYSCTKFPFVPQTKVIFAIGAKKDEGWVRGYDQKPFAEVDASIVATQMMLEIQDLGLNTTWVGSFDAPKMKELFPDMKDYELIALFPTGYAAKDAGPSPRHSSRKSKEEMVKTL